MSVDRSRNWHLQAASETATPEADADALRRLAAADREAVAELYDRHAARVLGLACRIVRNTSDAEDVVQDVFAQAWRTAPNYEASRGTIKRGSCFRADHRGPAGCAGPRCHVRAAGGTEDRPGTRVFRRAGGGVMWDRGSTALRVDARFIRALDDQEPEGNVFSESFGNLGFWRVGGGVAFRW